MKTGRLRLATVKDETGRRYGRLTVLRMSGIRNRQMYWVCKCDCGNQSETRGSSLRNGTTQSCGCQSSAVKFAVPVHGESGPKTITTEYRIWTDMIQRCENPRHHAYKWYGGRGITVCRRWRESYVDFLADVGRRPSLLLTLDRIDNNGAYEPSNIRWATAVQQAENRRPRTCFRLDESEPQRRERAEAGME